MMREQYTEHYGVWLESKQIDTPGHWHTGCFTAGRGPKIYIRKGDAVRAANEWNRRYSAYGSATAMSVTIKGEPING